MEHLCSNLKFLIIMVVLLFTITGNYVRTSIGMYFCKQKHET